MTNPACPFCSSTNVAWKDKKRLWECNDCEERFPGEETLLGRSTDPLASKEDFYLGRSRILAGSDLWQESIISTAPGPIAYTYSLLQRLLEKGQIDASALVLKDFAELIARVSALVMTRDILENGDPTVQNQTRETLFIRPLSMGGWIGLADLLARTINKVPTAYDVPQIANWWRDDKGERTSLCAVLSDKITAWRNESIGHGVRGDDLSTTMSDLERILGTGKESLHRCLGIIVKNPVILTDTDGNHLHGVLSGQPEHENAGHLETASGDLWIQGCDDKHKRLSLAPYISLRQCPICNSFETFHYDSTKINKTRIPDFRLLNYERGHAYVVRGNQGIDLIAELNCANKAQDITNEESFSADALPVEVVEMLESQSVEKSYISPSYLRDPLRHFIESRSAGSRGGVYWLQAPAHVGKSTFVRGLDPRYSGLWKESALVENFAVVVFYVRREYQYHCAQFADQLRDSLRDELRLRSQTQKLPDLDIFSQDPRSAFVRFLEHYQVLGGKPLLIVIDGLDELGDLHPGIADFIPITDDLPKSIFVLLTSRLMCECPAHVKAALEENKLTNCTVVSLGDAGYRMLMREYANGRLKKVSQVSSSGIDEALPILYDKSDGRFLYFSFLVDRLADGDIRQIDLKDLADDPERLVPDYLLALLQRYDGTSLKDLLQRTLCHLTAAEEAAIAHEQKLPLLARETWTGLPIDVLCQRLEGKSSMTPRVAYALYLLKPVLGSWRGNTDGPRYCLGIKGMREIVRQIMPVSVDCTHDTILRMVIEQSDEVSSDARWAISCLNGHGMFSSAIQDHVNRGDPYWRAIYLIFNHTVASAEHAYRLVRYRQAVSYYYVAQWLLDVIGTQDYENPLSEFREFASTLAPLIDRVRVLYGCASSLSRIGDSRSALEHIARAILVLESLPGSTYTFAKLAELYLLRGVLINNIDESFLSVRRAIDILQPSSTDKSDCMDPILSELLARAYGNLGNLWHAKGDLNETIKFYTVGVSLYDKMKLQLGEIDADIIADGTSRLLINRGVAYRGAGLFKEAQNDYLKAVEIREEQIGMIPDRLNIIPLENLASAYVNCGLISCEIGNPRQSIKYYEIAIEKWHELQNDVEEGLTPDMANGLALTLRNQGAAFNLTGQFRRAVASFDSAIQIWVKLKNSLGEQFPPDRADALARAYFNKGTGEIRLGHAKNALHSYNNAADIYIQIRETNLQYLLPYMRHALIISNMGRAVACSMLGDVGSRDIYFGFMSQDADYLCHELGSEITPDIKNSITASYSNMLASCGMAEHVSEVAVKVRRFLNDLVSQCDSTSQRVSVDILDTVVCACINLGVINFQSGDRLSSMELYCRATDLVESYAMSFPESFSMQLLEHYTVALINRAITQRTSCDAEDYWSDLIRAAFILRKLFGRFIPDYINVSFMPALRILDETVGAFSESPTNEASGNENHSVIEYGGLLHYIDESKLICSNISKAVIGAITSCELRGTCLLVIKLLDIKGVPMVSSL